jgi:hypothetical protein
MRQRDTRLANAVCQIGVHFSFHGFFTPQIQPPIAPLVHPKMNTGKEPLQMRNSEC